MMLITLMYICIVCSKERNNDADYTYVYLYSACSEESCLSLAIFNNFSITVTTIFWTLFTCLSPLTCSLLMARKVNAHLVPCNS